MAARSSVSVQRYCARRGDQRGGLHPVDRAESEQRAAFRFNADSATLVGRGGGQVGARLVQVSTDIVFEGDRPVPYDVDAVTRPLSYGDPSWPGNRRCSRCLGTQRRSCARPGCMPRMASNFVRTMLG